MIRRIHGVFMRISGSQLDDGFFFFFFMNAVFFYFFSFGCFFCFFGSLVFFCVSLSLSFYQGSLSPPTIPAVGGRKGREGETNSCCFFSLVPLFFCLLMCALNLFPVLFFFPTPSMTFFFLQSFCFFWSHRTHTHPVMFLFF